MKLCKYLLLIAVATSLLPMSVQAVTVEDLFTVELPVADQTTSLRLESFSEAFKQVIVKVSGSDEALQNPGFQRPIQNSARYVKQFRYVNRSLPEDEEYDLDRLLLRIDFDQQLIEGLLREQNFPVWGRERPSTLLVISYDVNENIKLVSDDATPDLVESLDQAAANYAVPVLFPLMDLEDIGLVSIRDIASRQYENIDVMARRYAPNALLVGKIVGRSGQGWQGDWEVRFDDQVFTWTFKASSKQVVIDQVIRHLAKTLAREFALEDHQQYEQSLLLSVSDLEGIAKLIKVQEYLKELNVVDNVRVAMVSKDVVTYRLQLRNNPEDLQRLIEFGEVLEQEDFPQISTEGEEMIISTTATLIGALAIKQIALPISLDRQFSFDNFIADESDLVVDSLQGLIAGAGEKQIGLWGSAASGKTHLLNASADFARKRGVSMQIYDAFQLRHCDAADFEGFDHCDLLAIDNLDALAGDLAWESCFYQVINRCQHGDYRFLFSMSCRPDDLPSRLDDFRSRLQWGLLLQLPQTGDAEVRHILRRRADLLGFNLSDDVISYLLTHHPRDLGEQISILQRLDGISLSQQRRVTIPLVKQALSETAD